MNMLSTVKSLKFAIPTSKLLSRKAMNFKRKYLTLLWKIQKSCNLIKN